MIGRQISWSAGALCHSLIDVRALVQRVTSAAVDSEGVEVGRIGPGLCVFVGVTHEDGQSQATKLAEKLWHIRLMDDDEGVMNLSVADTTCELLVVSQFTLYGDTRKGRRPSWIEAARPDHAEPLIEILVEKLKSLGAVVATGRFRTDMKVSLVNDGPVTVAIEV